MSRPSKKTLVRKLDKLAGQRCRDRGKCEASGYRKNNKTKPVKCTAQLQWCHIKSRRYYSVRWSENNCFCLCASHHRWFTNNPDDFMSFAWDRYPDRMEALDEEFKAVYPIKTWQLEELFNDMKNEN